MRFILGIDIGGTFTDAAAVDVESNQLYAAKARSTPHDLTKGVLDALDLIAEQVGISRPDLLARTTKCAHGTTQTSNIMFQWAGARTGLITTRGFGDQLLIMRAKGRVAGLSLSERRHFRTTDKPPKLVTRTFIKEVAERIDYKGAVLVPLDEAAVEQAVQELVKGGVEAIAIGFLWSFRNPGHERRAAEIVRRVAPKVYVSVSSELAPVLGEYERLATAVVNSYVGPTMVRYLDSLQASLQSAGLTKPLLILQASGGVAHADHTVPVNTIDSGPAAGVVGTKFLADAMGLKNIIATDVGGTTFKVSLIVNGEWSFARETSINQYSLLIPMIDIVSIGAGGGSIAWVDGARLRVGPESAQADPGPAAYGWGGTRPTVTDADVVLGLLNPAYFLGGRLALRKDLAERAIREHIADKLFDGDVVRAAAGIREVVDSQMADLVRKVTIERGHDPRDFVLMAYGGAGPLHGTSYGRDVGCARVVIPMEATVHSAFGAAASDLHHSVQLSAPEHLPADPERVTQHYTRLEAAAAALLRRQGIPAERLRLSRWAEMRYRRQMHEVRVPVPAGRLDAAGIDLVAGAFERKYEALNGPGSAYRQAGMEIVSFGVDALGRIEKPVLPRQERGGADASAARVGTRPVYWIERRAFVETSIYRGERLRPGHRVSGPAVIELAGTTIAVHPGDVAEVDEHLNTVIEFGGRGRA